MAGLATSGDEGSSVLYQFKVGQFTLTWHDTVGPLRERAPALLGLLRRLPRTDVELGSTLGFNDPTNGQRDPVDYVTALKPQFFYPMHHDFIAEYGVSKGLEGVFRRELAKRAPIPTEIRWLYDPQDYLRPKLMTFDVEAARFADPGSCLARRSPLGQRNIGRVGVGLTRRRLLRAGARAAAAHRSLLALVREGLPRLGAAPRSRARGRVALLASTASGHGNRRVRPGGPAARLARSYPRRRALGRGLFAAGHARVRRAARAGAIHGRRLARRWSGIPRRFAAT